MVSNTHIVNDAVLSLMLWSEDSETQICPVEGPRT